MTCPDHPKEYFTITSIDEYDGTPSTIGIFEDMRAVSYRLQRMYTHCGSEYRVECFHVSTAEAEASELTEQQVNRAKYQKQERDKDAAVKELAELKNGIKTIDDLEEEQAAWKNN